MYATDMVLAVLLLYVSDVHDTETKTIIQKKPEPINQSNIISDHEFKYEYKEYQL